MFNVGTQFSHWLFLALALGRFRTQQFLFTTFYNKLT